MKPHPANDMRKVVPMDALLQWALTVFESQFIPFQTWDNIGIRRTSNDHNIAFNSQLFSFFLQLIAWISLKTVSIFLNPTHPDVG